MLRLRSDSAEVEAPPAVAARFADTLDAAMTPAPEDALQDWLVELDVIAPKRADDGITAALRLRAYTNRLRDYPADVAKHALLGRTWPFWPSWAELKDACDELVRDRQRMLFAARRAAAQAEPEEPRERVTPEQRAAILAEAGLSDGRLAAVLAGRAMPSVAAE